MNIILSALLNKSIDNPRDVIIQNWKGSPSYVTGCLIKGDSIYSICNGQVLAISQDDKSLWGVTIQYNSQVWIRYCLLNDYNVSVGQYVYTHDLIGRSSNNMMRLEYCTPDISNFPVREIDIQMYKHDPTPIIFGPSLL
jgi:hypothetical protein